MTAPDAPTPRESSRLVPTRVPQMSVDEYAALITDIYLRNVDRMRAFARARGARFLLVLQPEVGSKPLPSPDEQNALARWDTLKGYVRRGFPDRYAAMRKAAVEFCARQQIALPHQALLMDGHQRDLRGACGTPPSHID